VSIGDAPMVLILLSIVAVCFGHVQSYIARDDRRQVEMRQRDVDGFHQHLIESLASPARLRVHEVKAYRRVVRCHHCGAPEQHRRCHYCHTDLPVEPPAPKLKPRPEMSDYAPEVFRPCP
jgi:hypothetical protein